MIRGPIHTPPQCLILKPPALAELWCEGLSISLHNVRFEFPPQSCDVSTSQPPHVILLQCWWRGLVQCVQCILQAWGLHPIWLSSVQQWSADRTVPAHQEYAERQLGVALLISLWQGRRRQRLQLWCHPLSCIVVTCNNKRVTEQFIVSVHILGGIIMLVCLVRIITISNSIQFSSISLSFSDLPDAFLYTYLYNILMNSYYPLFLL